MQLKETNKLLFNAAVVAGTVFLALIIYFAFFLRVKISVDVTPQNAVVTVDNAPLKIKDGKASASVAIGKHTIKVEADDYIGYKEDVELGRGHNYSKKISLNPAPTPIEIANGAANIAISGNQVFYQNLNDKLIYRAEISVSADGRIKASQPLPITAKPIITDKIIWSPTAELLFLKNGGSVNLFDFKKYDFVNQAETPFSTNVGDIAWAPDNSRVAYVYQSATADGERTLILSDKTNKTIYRAADLKTLGIENPYIAFSPDSAWIVIIPRNGNFADNKIYLMSVYSKEVRKISDAGSQKEAVFSADSSKIIYSTFSTDPNNAAHRDLSVMKLDGSDAKSLGIQAKATNIRLWGDPNKVFLLGDSDSSKLKLIDLISLSQADFYFKGQAQAEISEVVLNADKTGAIFVSNGKLYFVKLASN